MTAPEDLLSTNQIVSFVHVLCVWEQLAGSHLPERPLSSRGSPHPPLSGGQPLVIGEDHVVALLLRDVVPVWLEFIRKDVTGSVLIEEEKLRTATHEYSSKHESSHSVRMEDRVGET